MTQSRRPGICVDCNKPTKRGPRAFRCRDCDRINKAARQRTWAADNPLSRQQKDRRAELARKRRRRADQPRRIDPDLEANDG